MKKGAQRRSCADFLDQLLAQDLQVGTNTPPSFRSAGRRESASLRTQFAFAPSALASSFDSSETVYGPVIGIPASRHLATGFAQSGNGSPHGMPQPAEPVPDLRDRSAFGSLEKAD